MEAPSGFEPEMEVLQTSALPLGDGADRVLREGKKMERETGFEPATSTLARSHSTTELFPLATNADRTTAIWGRQLGGSASRNPPYFAKYRSPTSRERSASGFGTYLSIRWLKPFDTYRLPSESTEKSCGVAIPPGNVPGVPK
jgi:hypothetical protein